MQLQRRGLVIKGSVSHAPITMPVTDREGRVRSESLSWVARGAGLAIGVGLVLLLAGVVAMAREVFLIIFVAVLLGAALEPVVGTIRGRTGIGRGLSILIVYAAFLVAVVAVALFIVPAAAVQIGAAVGHFPTFLEQVRTWSTQLRPEALSEGIGSVIDAIEAPLKPGPPPSADSVLGASLIVGQVTAALVTLLVLVFFWLTERSRLQRYALAFMPARRRAGIREGWNEVEARLGLWVRGQLVLMLTIGVATGVAYSLLGLPAALLLALIAALTEVIPIVGPLIGAVPALLMATTVSPETVVLTLGVYVLLQLIEGNVLVPMIMRNSVGLSPFLVLVSLLVGGAVAGILGAIVAVPTVAGITVVLGRLQDRETPVPIDPAALEAPEDEANAIEASGAADSPALKRRRKASAARA
ncbi:MAG: AI-2E family transporter [Chloroflexi bacterium]|nr:AI-2E family transporter [Chloroflexota bacterium]